MNKQPEITTKEIFERLIKLEAKFDLMGLENKTTVRHFRMWAILVVILEIVNILVHWFG